ncbi:glycosyltransferase [Microbacterium laevaniformans]|uniref:glycosyltransferase n=1 Tax=Microbacterium laevaniformans TaxID=36807 RepID=UPI003D951FC1
MLHVVDRLTGGVPAAVASYIRSSDPAFKHVIASPRGEAAQAWRSLDVRTIDLGVGHGRRIMTLRRIINETEPSAVHAHSSFAGAYARLAVSRNRHHIVYTPHCFSFMREDLNKVAKAGYFAIEWLLSFNTSVLLACSATEQKVAASLPGTRARTSFAPNLSELATLPASPTYREDLVVGMVGRVSIQKDPDHFVRALEAIRESGIAVKGVWIGDGESEQRDKLINAGVEVTGWLAPDAVSEKLSELDIYLHSAAWEGFPIALLDAHQAGLPSLYRRSRSLSELPDDLSFDRQLAHLVVARNDAESWVRWSLDNHQKWSEVFTAHSRAEQRDALRRAWKPI